MCGLNSGHSPQVDNGALEAPSLGWEGHGRLLPLRQPGRGAEWAALWPMGPPGPYFA